MAGIELLTYVRTNNTRNMKAKEGTASLHPNLSECQSDLGNKVLNKVMALI